METFRRILAAAVEGGASDIHLKVGAPIIFRISRKLVVVEGPLPTMEWMETVVDNIVPKHSKEQLNREHECDFSYYLPNTGRFRTNCFFQRGQPCLAMWSMAWPICSVVVTYFGNNAFNSGSSGPNTT